MKDTKTTPQAEYEMIKEFIEGFWGITVPSLQGMDRRLFERLLSPGTYLNRDKRHAPFFGALRSLRRVANEVHAYGVPIKSIEALLIKYSNLQIMVHEIAPYTAQDDIRAIEFIKKWQIERYGSVWTLLDKK